ncbi:hypothetical protein WN51_06702 [Melipona quadrifasciata]|uniref:Uncharacterized protein n=1 Tax=Melipona quadrifasciata TaxID=166423 RepID=A0A0M9ACE8_9HYME|nr:hypothetical protein WN51_06702 [Melipona quadrifasciata]
MSNFLGRSQPFILVCVYEFRNLAYGIGYEAYAGLLLTTNSGTSVSLIPPRSSRESQFHKDSFFSCGVTVFEATRPIALTESPEPRCKTSAIGATNGETSNSEKFFHVDNKYFYVFSPILYIDLNSSPDMACHWSLLSPATRHVDKQAWFEILGNFSGCVFFHFTHRAEVRVYSSVEVKSIGFKKICLKLQVWNCVMYVCLDIKKHPHVHPIGIESHCFQYYCDEVRMRRGNGPVIVWPNIGQMSTRNQFHRTFERNIFPIGSPLQTSDILEETVHNTYNFLAISLLQSYNASTSQPLYTVSYQISFIELTFTTKKEIKKRKKKNRSYIINSDENKR